MAELLDQFLYSQAKDRAAWNRASGESLRRATLDEDEPVMRRSFGTRSVETAAMNPGTLVRRFNLGSRIVEARRNAAGIVRTIVDDPRCKGTSLDVSRRIFLRTCKKWEAK